MLDGLVVGDGVCWVIGLGDAVFWYLLLLGVCGLGGL